MKRRRRLFHSIAIQFLHLHAYGGEVLPPGSIVKAKDKFVGKHGTTLLKVEYYSKIFGLNEVFLVDSDGKQKVWLNQREVRAQFDIVELSNDQDHFQTRVAAEERYWKGSGHRAWLK